MSITIWHALEASDSELVANGIRLEAHAVKREFQASVESQSSGLSRMAKRWEAEGGTPRVWWEADATAYLDDQDAYQAIEWVDSTFHARWIEGNGAVGDSDIASEEELIESRETRQRMVTSPVDLEQGGKGFLVYYPLCPRDQFGGFLLGIYRFEGLFKTIIGDGLSAEFALAVSAGPDLVYQSPGADTRLKDDWGENVSLDLLGVPLQAVLWPSPSYLAGQKSALPDVVLALGLFLTAVLVVCAYAAQTAVIRGGEAGGS